jgi:hypothetical protein
VTRFPILVAALLALPASAPTSPTWEVKMSGEDAETAPILACNRTAPNHLECVDLEILIRAKDEMDQAEREQAERKEAQRKRWQRREVIDL